jgi:type II secretory pathway pseudopilin PulG
MSAQRLTLSFGLTHPCPRIETRQGHRPLVAQPEAGFTLVELLIVMPFLLIVTTLMMVTLTTAYGAASQVQSTSNASSQVTLAFMTLDSEIRYAADINEPGADSSNPPNYYVEFESSWETNPTCTQLEYANSTGQLLQRSWTPPASAPTGWQILASGMQTSISSDPFSLADPQGSPWQLSVGPIWAVSGTGSTKGKAESSFTVTALDTTENSVSQGVCGGTP